MLASSSWGRFTPPPLNGGDRAGSELGGEVVMMGEEPAGSERGGVSGGGGLRWLEAGEERKTGVSPGWSRNLCVI